MRDFLSHRARIEPDGEALVVAESGDGYTFGNLDTLVDDLAGRLAAAGVDPGDHLGAVLRSRLEYVCLVHAAMRLGATLVPMGDGLTPRELAGQIDAADVTSVVCGEDTEAAVVDAVSRIEGAEAGAGDSDEPAADADADTDPERESEFEFAPDSEPITVLAVDDPSTERPVALSETPAEEVKPADWALDGTQLILFTSGTTGDPKAVRLTVENLLASAVASVFRLGFDPTDRWLVTLSLHHMGGIAPVLRMPLYGMAVVLRESFAAGPAVDDVDRYDVTATSLVPTMLDRMLDRRGTLPESLRVVLLGGAPASAELIERCQAYSVPVHPTYGMTETASQIATARPREAFAAPDSVGRPLLFTEVTVVDEAGASLPPGEPGEIVVDAPTVTPGYYGDAAATEDAFGPFGFHTGDVGVRDEDGSLTVLNRLDDRIVSGGENVDPGEVVEVLRGHPDVADAAVVGVPDAEWGERVSALVVGAGEGDPDRADLLDFARERLAAYKIPKTVAFADALPRTVSGTVDRAAVRDRLSGDDGDRAPADEDSATGGAADAAESPPDGDRDE
ncbi:o-succinylbenzoate--CoA ligase [Halobellus sp. EA9]|uniref:o-succinylbenzoate--CoA ligase n=1 Tax=Halobellus sp. EA9 TaxID=3421647 RepID=UPI003EBBFD81